MNILPVSPLYCYSFKKRPIWSTLVHTSVSGRETRAALWSYPKWEFELLYDTYYTEEINNIIAFFMQQMGSFEAFLFYDLSELRVYGEALGTGDGSTTEFQLIRNWGTFDEPIYHPAPLPPYYGYGVEGYGEYGYGGSTVYVDGTLPPYIYFDGSIQYSGYSTSTTGLITFNLPPNDGVVITADFSYYYKVRFKDDMIDFENFEYRLWKSGSITLLLDKE